MHHDWWSDVIASGDCLVGSDKTEGAASCRITKRGRNRKRVRKASKILCHLMPLSVSKFILGEEHYTVCMVFFMDCVGVGSIDELQVRQLRQEAFFNKKNFRLIFGFLCFFI
jgi:hypothetical protein